VELRHLRYFVTVAETGNFHRAAERLNMSQPPLTVAIRNLERELGCALFTRGPRGVMLTGAGELALEHARAALRQAEHFRDAARERMAGQRGRLTVGFVGSATYAFLPLIIPLFRRRFPHVELTLEESTTATLLPAVRDRRVDVALVRLPFTRPRDVEIAVVEEDEMVAAVPAASALAMRRIIPLHDLAGFDFVNYTAISGLNATMLAACQAAGFSPHVAQEAAQVQTLLALVESGLGVALVPGRCRRQLPDGVRLVPLRDPPRLQLAIALAADSPSPLALNLRALALAHHDSFEISD